MSIVATAMAGGTDNNGWGHRQQSTKIVDNNKDDDNDDNDEHDKHDGDEHDEDKHDDKDNEYDKHNDNEHNDDDHDDKNHNNDDDDDNDNNIDDDDGNNEDDNNGDDNRHNNSDGGSGWRQRQRWQQHGRSNICRGHANNCPGSWRRRTCLHHHLGGLWVLVVVVVCEVVRAGCVCAARTCCFV
jgi:hypothetical protein